MSSIIIVNDHTNKIALGTAQFGFDYGVANKNGQVKKDEVSQLYIKDENKSISHKTSI